MSQQTLSLPFEVMVDTAVARMNNNDPGYFVGMDALEQYARDDIRRFAATIGSQTLERLTGTHDPEQLTATRAVLGFGCVEGEVSCLVWPRAENSPQETTFHGPITREFGAVKAQSTLDDSVSPDAFTGFLVRGPEHRQAFFSGTSFNVSGDHEKAMRRFSDRFAGTLGYCLLEKIGKGESAYFDVLYVSGGVADELQS